MSNVKKQKNFGVDDSFFLDRPLAISLIFFKSKNCTIFRHESACFLVISNYYHPRDYICFLQDLDLFLTINS